MGDFSTFAAEGPDVSLAIRRVSTRSIALALIVISMSTILCPKEKML
ncbi:MAG TPA: hypothetical protein VFK30_05260 [Anaerolineae bacterium]|nr:hypothetical protein [Anaerolineae bacterium]